MKKVVITTGGTGGHIFPALAVAEEIRRRYPRAVILFLGGMYGPESELAAKAGLEFTGLPVRGVMGRGLKGAAALFGMGRSVLKAYGFIRSHSPDLVVGFGGYAAFCGVLAAVMSSPRTAIHEQNAFPGLVNKVLGKMVDAVFLSMPDASESLPAAKSVLVGNPVREKIAALGRRRSHNPGPGRLLVLGGSQGARAINDGMVSCLKRFIEAGTEILHQTGRADYERVRAAYEAADAQNARVTPFIDDMAGAYDWADLVLSRSGASSLAEITAAGLPSVLVPFPQAVRDHQRHNAMYLVEQGAALLLDQTEFAVDGPGAGKLADLTLELLHDKAALDGMSVKSLSLAKPEAAARMVDALEKLLMRK